MLLIKTTLTAWALGIAINAQLLADRILNKRTALSAGGWALTAPAGSCPASATSCDSGWCCPSSLTCTESDSGDISSLCCPGSSSCVSSLQASPACADNSWSLWNATQSAYQFGYFCCLPLQAGLAVGGCIDASQVPAYKNQIGVLISAAIGTGTSTSTTSGGTATGTGSPATGTASSTSSSSVATSTTGKPNNARRTSSQGVGVVVLVLALVAVSAVGLL